MNRESVLEQIRNMYSTSAVELKLDEAIGTFDRVYIDDLRTSARLSDAMFRPGLRRPSRS